MHHTCTSLHMYSVHTAAGSMQLISHKSQLFYSQHHSPDLHLVPALPSHSTIVCHSLSNRVYCLAVALRMMFLQDRNHCLPCNSCSKIVFDHCLQALVRILHGLLHLFMHFREWGDATTGYVCCKKDLQQICPHNAVKNQRNKDFKGEIYHLWQHTEGTVSPVNS